MENLVESLDLGYTTIYEAFQNFFDLSLINNLMWAIKILAITLFVLSIGTNMVQNIGKKFGSDIKVDLPFDTNKLITSLIYVLLIASYDQLLGLLDSILLPLDGVFSDYSPLSLNESEPPLEEISEDTAWYTSLKEAAEMMLDMLTGLGDWIILGLIYVIASIIDAMIYVVFLVERFFFLGLLKILGPFAILLSIFRAKSEMFWKWLKVYTAVYLLIFPFFLIIGFTNEIVDILNTKIESYGVVDIIFGRGIKATVLLLMIWIKLRLFKKSYELVYKVIS